LLLHSKGKGVKVNVKVTPEQAMKAQRGVDV
jgi:hypothetical protein